MNANLRKTIRFVAWTVLVFVVFKVLTFDYPILSGMTIIDARDPNRPGGLREVFPTPLGLAVEGIVLLACAFVLFKTRSGQQGRQNNS